MRVLTPWTRSLCFVITVILPCYVTGTFEGCRIRYGRRGCTDKVHEGVLVTCDGSGVQSVLPPSIPEDTVYVSLVNFQFGALHRVNFTGLRKVECIHILDSNIRSLDFDTFSDMELLHELEIRNTNLTSQHVQFINHPDFRGRLVTVNESPSILGLQFNGTAALQKLKELHLESNGISSISSSILSNLITIEKLSLSNNNLNTMDWNKIINLAKLNELSLDNNKLQTIPEHVIQSFGAVKQLYLAGNPFHCNCKLRWLKEFYDTTTDKLLDYENVMCTSPFSKRMIDTFVEEFSCAKPSEPKVVWTELKDGEEYIVNCSSESDPAPTLTITLPDGKLLQTPPTDDLSRLSTESPRIIVGPGIVICEAVNSEGTSITELHIPYEGYSMKPNGAPQLPCISMLTTLVTIFTATVYL